MIMGVLRPWGGHAHGAVISAPVTQVHAQEPSNACPYVKVCTITVMPAGPGLSSCSTPHTSTLLIEYAALTSDANKHRVLLQQ